MVAWWRRPIEREQRWNLQRPKEATRKKTPEEIPERETGSPNLWLMAAWTLIPGRKLTPVSSIKARRGLLRCAMRDLHSRIALHLH